MSTLEDLYKTSIHSLRRVPTPQEPHPLTQSQSVTIFKNWGEHGWTKEQTTTTRIKSSRHTKLLLGSRNRPPVNTVLQGADGYSIWQWKGIQRGWLRLQPKRLLSEFKPLYASPKKSQPAEESAIVCAGGWARHLDLKLPIHLPIEKSGRNMSVEK